MKICSYVKASARWQTIEVEINLGPGISDVFMTGLPSLAIKESIRRIKSAFRSQGFRWPSGQNVIIHLKPAYLQKKSEGLDLAIALAVLKASGQLNLSEDFDEQAVVYAYGELGLNGEILAPRDLDQLALSPQHPGLITGRSPSPLCFSRYQVRELAMLKHGKWVPATPFTDLIERPPLSDLQFPAPAARLLEILAAGGHHCLIAGPAGSGKTTLAEVVVQLMPVPQQHEFLLMQRVLQFTGQSLKWRPFASPHHSTPPISMIGGGVPIFPGELTRACAGVLVMDEYLEFHPRVQEALREPLETGRICVTRGGESLVLPAQFNLIATTNLCPCGDLVPDVPKSCSYSLQRCRSNLDRLSGPMLDRFDILSFSNKWNESKLEDKVHSEEILRRVTEAATFQQKRGQKVFNGKLQLQGLEQASPLQDWMKPLLATASQRRKRALLRVARTLADLDQETEPKLAHLREARALTFESFYKLKRVFT